MNSENKESVVLFTYPIISHINPLLSIIDELVARKFNVVVFSISKFQSLLELHNVVYIGYGAEAENAIEGFEQESGDIRYMFKYATACAEETDKYLKYMSNYCPQIIIHDTMSLIGKQISDITKIPSVSICTSFAVKKAVGGIPYVSRRKAVYIYATRFVDYLYFKIKNYLFSKKYKIINAKTINLYFNYEKLNIVCALKWMQPHNDMYGDEFKFVGELVCEERGMKCNIDLLKSDKKLLYISFGTILAADIDFYKICIEVFKHSKYNVIMNIGKYNNPSLFGKLPSNFYIANYLPQVEILKKAALFITHGGMNSVTEAIKYGVPMILIPMSGDEPSVAKALVEMGAGILLDRSNINDIVLKSTVEHMMEDDSYQRQCSIFRDKYIEAGGGKAAVSAICEYYRDN